MMKNKISNFLEFAHLSQFSIVNAALFYIKSNFEKLKIYIKLVVSLKVIELQRCKIPHFKALDLLF